MDNDRPIIEQISGEEIPVVDNVEIVETKPSLALNMPDWLTAKTGEGSLESYLEHPMNFNKSLAIARIIRGATGILGSLDLAVIDIGMGMLEFIKGRKAGV
jgi:hypothetical protein